MARDKQGRKVNDSAEEARIRRDTSMNLDEAFLRVLAAKGGAPGPAGGPGRVATASSNAGSTRRNQFNEPTARFDPETKQMVANENIDWNAMLSKLGRSPATKETAASVGFPFAPAAQNSINLGTLAARSLEKYQPVVRELSRFKFAEAEDKRDEQINEVVAAVKEALQKMAVRQVAAATRRTYENVTDVARVLRAQSTVGMKVTYKVGGVSLAVTAEGDFAGDEIICLEQEGQTASYYVVRPGGDGFEDVTGHFRVSVQPVA